MQGQRNLFQVGEKYGLLTITRRWAEKSPHHKTKETYCECKCNCGTIGIVLRACYFRDKRKKTFSCGCLTKRGRRKLYKPGERFGKLVILRRWTEKRLNSSKESICECQCDCGNKAIIKSKDLKGGQQSCGCIRHRINKEHGAWKGYGDISGSRWSSIRGGAKRRSRDIPFEITIQQVWDLFNNQNSKCALSGVEISFSERDRRYKLDKRYKDGTASLDRIDSAKGYTIDNIQWVHKDVNLMKWHLPQDIFINWCKLITGKSVRQKLQLY